MPTDSLAELRQLLRTHRPRRSRDGYPVDVREAVVAAAPAYREAGWTPNGLAVELGLAPTTLAKWLRQSVASSFRQVSIVSAPVPWTRVSLTLITPGGFRLEGLDLDTAAALVARLS
jgi:hypothetical protein